MSNRGNRGLDMEVLGDAMGVPPSQAERIADFMVTSGHVRSKREELKRRWKRAYEEAARNGG